MAKDDETTTGKDKQKEHSYKERLDELELIRNQKHQNVNRPRKISKKLPELKKQRFNANKFRAASLIGLFSVVILMMMYVVLPISKVQKINISGQLNMSDREIEKSADVKKGDLILSVMNNLTKYEKSAVKNNVQLKSIQISVTGYRTVNINVVENKIVGLENINNKYYPVLTTGEIKKVPQDVTKYNEPIYKGFKSAVILKKVVKQMNKLPDAILQNVSEIEFDQTVKAPERIRLYMNDGNEVLVKYSQLSKKMSYYPEIANQMNTNGVVDLQVGAYSYPYGAKDE